MAKHPTPARARRGLFARLGALLAAALLTGACSSSDDARVLQVLNQRGFGRPTQDANRQYYIGVGDTVVMRDSSGIYKEYSGVVEPVRMDGTITLPDVGEVYVNGLTPTEASEVIRQRYDSIVQDSSGLTVRVTGIRSKKYYITGVPPRSPRSVIFKGDTYLLDAVIQAKIDENLVDTDNILVIRGDPENPLVISCDYNAIKTQGLTRDNIQIRENDIVYLEPSIVGYITWFVSALTAPLKPIQNLIFGVNNVITVSESFGQGGLVGQGNNNNNNFNNNF